MLRREGLYYSTLANFRKQKAAGDLGSSGSRKKRASKDPAMAAARNADWDQFLGSHDYRYGVIVKDMIQGRTARETAAGNGAGFAHIYPLKYRLADELREFLGDDAVADALRIPAWRGNIVADREKTACRAERRRA